MNDLEEATTKWSSEEERKQYKVAYKQIKLLQKELLGDEK